MLTPVEVIETSSFSAATTKRLTPYPPNKIVSKLIALANGIQDQQNIQNTDFSISVLLTCCACIVVDEDTESTENRPTR